MSRIKVLMIAHEDIFDGVGGLGVHIKAIAGELKDKIDLTILCKSETKSGLFLYGDTLGGNVSRAEWKPRKGHYRVAIIENNNDLNIKHPLIQTIIIDRVALSNALFLFGQETFDIIHLQDVALWHTARCLRDLWKIPIVTSIHLSYILGDNSLTGDYHLLFLQREGSAVTESDYLMTCSRYYKEELERVYCRDDIAVVPNGVDSLDGIKVETVKGRIGFVGRFVPSKGMELIFKAVKKLKDKEFLLLSAKSGSMSDNAPWIKHIEKMAIKRKNLRWLPNHDQGDKWRLMKSCEFGIVPSLHEPFGIVALEWMALGVPLIVSNTGGLSEFCNISNSIMFDPVKDDFVKVLNSAIVGKKKIAKGLETAKEYNWEKPSDKIFERYEEILC